MHQTVEAIMDPKGNIRLLEPIKILASQRVLVTFLDNEPIINIAETALLSEAALAEDWNKSEEDAAWSHLQQAPSS